MELSNAGFSTLKTQIKKAGAKPAAKPGRPAGKAAAPSTNGHGSVASSVAAIKKLVDELGAEQVKQIADIVK